MFHVKHPPMCPAAENVSRETVAKWKDSFCCRLEFTTESENETWNVLEYFYGSRTDLPYTEYTTGHEKRGVE